MEATFTLEGQRIADELASLFEAIEGGAASPSLVARATDVAERLRVALRAEVEPRATAVQTALREALEALERATPGDAGEAAWARFVEQVRPSHEALAAALARMSAAARPPRPMNRARMIMHVLMGSTSALLTVVLPRGWLVALPLVFVVFAWTSEFSRVRSPAVNARLMKFFGPVAHAHEWHRVNSSTWFVTGLLLIAAVFPRPACAVAVMALAVGDPAASLVGRRFGRTRLRSGRSVEGTLAFAVVATVASAVLLRLGFHMRPSMALALGAVAGITGAITEVSSERLDDNFSIPVTVAAVVTAAQLLAGVS